MTAAVVRLTAVGDLQLGDSPTCVGFGFRSRVSAQALARALERFSSLIGRADVGFGNLETPLSDVGADRHRRRTRQLRGDPAYADVLGSGGFTVLNVANNHALEHGPEAFLDSAARVESLGIVACGRRGTDAWTAQPATLVVRGLRVGCLGYSLRPMPDEPDNRPYAVAKETQILADVKRLRSQSDSVIVSLHWGEEFAQLPSAAEVALAHAVVDAGAAVILGHHPHVARPVERYGGAVIAYSLGNFAGDMVWYPPHREGLVLDCELTARGVGDIRVHRAYVQGSYLPRADERADVPVSGPISGLSEEEYIHAARRTVRAQRRALYLYTARNAWRFEPRVFVELAASTVQGKLSRLSSGKKDKIWG